MTSVIAKYNNLRSLIENGDIILVRGRSWLPRIIEWADNSYYSHALVVFKSGERLFAIQSMAGGVMPYFLSTEIASNVDFCIIKPLFFRKAINEYTQRIINEAEKGIPYNDWELPRILLNKKLGIKFNNIQGNKNDNICSVFAGFTYGKFFPMQNYLNAYAKQGYLTPQDLIRYANEREVKIIGNHPTI